MFKYFIGFVRYRGDGHWLCARLKQFRRLAYWFCHDWYWVGYRLLLWIHGWDRTKGQSMVRSRLNVVGLNSFELFAKINPILKS